MINEEQLIVTLTITDFNISIFIYISFRILFKNKGEIKKIRCLQR